MEDRQNQSEEDAQLLNCSSSPSCGHAHLRGWCQHVSVQAGPILLPLLPNPMPHMQLLPNPIIISPIYLCVHRTDQRVHMVSQDNISSLGAQSVRQRSDTDVSPLWNNLSRIWTSTFSFNTLWVPIEITAAHDCCLARITSIRFSSRKQRRSGIPLVVLMHVGGKEDLMTSQNEPSSPPLVPLAGRSLGRLKMWLESSLWLRTA